MKSEVYIRAGHAATITINPQSLFPPNPSILQIILILASRFVLRHRHTDSMSNQISGPLFQEYIGAKANVNVKISDVPKNPEVTFHFVLSFATDYDANGTAANGVFSPHWKTTFTPDQVREIKKQYPNVKVILGVGARDVKFPFTVNSESVKTVWVENAVFSLGNIIDEYELDGIEVNYGDIQLASKADFAYCVGELIKKLKEGGVIKFASIAPSSKHVSEYQEVYTTYKEKIDIVSYQFYTHSLKSAKDFISLYLDILDKFPGANLLAGLSTDKQDAEYLTADVFFRGCEQLKAQGNLSVGIFIWSAEDSIPAFEQEKRAQDLLVSP